MRLQNGQWGTVCDDHFDDTDAKLICKMLGYSKGRARPNAYFGEGTEYIWMDDLKCTGSESSIFDCSFDNGYNVWGDHDCNHGEDAGVECRNLGMNPILGSY